jgi:hypothetical protein
VDYLHKLCILVSATMCSLWTVHQIPSVMQSLISLLCGLWHCLTWNDCKFTLCHFPEEGCQRVMVGIYFFKKYGPSNFPHMCLLHTGLLVLGCSRDLHGDFWNTSICCLALYSAIHVNHVMPKKDASSGSGNLLITDSWNHLQYRLIAYQLEHRVMWLFGL